MILPSFLLFLWWLCLVRSEDRYGKRFLDETQSNTAAVTLSSNNSRFLPLSRDKQPKKYEQLLLFISITSSPHHSHLRHANRFTWLLPCIASPVCDYKFFIDKAKNTSEDLFGELTTYDDIVFRDSCDLMNRHPDNINYGNSPPREETLHEIPDYQFRRMYKVDWKVCFMRYARDHNKMAEYHVFVEDDSFICTENLLYQVQLLHNRSMNEKIPIFRTGTAMFDGFDDSSTFMSKDVALIFANYYNTNNINCTKVVDYPNSESWNASMWLSWGNSWMKLRCDWFNVIKKELSVHIIKPISDCLYATSISFAKYHVNLKFPCTEHQIIMHHGTAGEILLHSNTKHIKHICEYMLLIDKVKEPKIMYNLWNDASVEHNFHDFSSIFMHENETGWIETLNKLENDEIKCRKLYNFNENEMKNCIFEVNKRRLRRLTMNQRHISDTNQRKYRNPIENNNNDKEHRQSTSIHELLKIFYDIE